MREISLDIAGEEAHENGLLEHRIWTWMNADADQSPTMQGLQTAFERHEAGPGVGLLKQLGVSIEGGVLVAQDPEHITATIEQRELFSPPSQPKRMNSIQRCWRTFLHEKTSSKPVSEPCATGR